jgi:hypothetical protein
MRGEVGKTGMQGEGKLLSYCILIISRIFEPNEAMAST